MAVWVVVLQTSLYFSWHIDLRLETWQMLFGLIGLKKLSVIESIFGGKKYEANNMASACV